MATKTAEEFLKDYGGWEKDRENAAQIRQEAKTDGTWGKSAAEIIAVMTRGKTAAAQQSVQKAKEDRIDAKSVINPALIKRDRTKKDYEDYVNSEEYRKKQTADIIAQQLAKDRDESQSSASTSDTMPPAPKQDDKEARLRAARDQAEAEYNAEEDRKVMEADLEAINGLSAEERRQLELYTVGRDVDYYNSLNMAQNGFQMGRAERNAADLIAKYGQQRVDEMANTLSRQNNARLTQEIATMGQQHGDKHAVLGSVGSVAASAFGGVMGTMDYIKEMGRNDGRYKTLDPNAMGNVGNVYAGAVRGQVGQNISGDVYDENGNLLQDGGKLRGALAIGYQGIMSNADSIARAYLGGGAFGGSMLAATGSFSQTMADASKQGATPVQAALLATTTAALEAATEKIPLDRLIKQAGGGKQAITTILKNALVQGGIEATTEEISLVGSLLAEAAILREKSNYEQTVMVQIMQGKSPTEARAIAAQQICNEVINTALVSMISGGTSSVAGSVKANMEADRQDIAPNTTNSEGMKQELMQKLQGLEAQKTETTAESPVVQNSETAQEKQPQVEAKQPAQAEAAPQTQQVEQPQSARQETPEASAQQEDTYTGVQMGASNVQDQSAEGGQDAVAIADALRNSGGKKVFKHEGYTVRKYTGGQYKGEPYFSYRIETPDGQVIKGETAYYNQSFFEGVAEEIARHKSESGNNQQSNEEQIRGTGAAEANFSGKAEYQDLLSEDNAQRDRPGDVRPMEVPKTDSFGRHVSELVANAYGAEITSDKMANTIEELVQEGALGFDRRSNQESMNTAAAEIQRKGVAATRTQITNAVARGKIKDGDIEQAILLYAMYNSKDTQAAQDNASEILVDLATMANITGRNLQMFRLLRKLTPEGQVSTIRKTVQKNVEAMARGGAVKKGYAPDIDPELLNQYRQAAQENMRAVSEEQKKSSEEKMQLIMDYIYKIEASKMPATMKAKWDAWRYMAMLGNVKTQVRNIGGNIAFAPYKVVKDRVAALGEKLFVVPKDQRTKSLFTDPELLKWARQDRETANVADALKYSAKLGDDVTSQKFRDQMQVFKSKKLDATRKFVEAVPAWVDMQFKNGYYARSLADFMRARGYKAADIQNGTVSQEVLNEARAYAIQEAMKATFNDSNVVSDFLATEARYKGENPVGKIVNTAFEGVMPFRRTPANVAVRFEEYSPVGIVNTLWKAGDALITGKTTAASVVDSLASSLTGSGAMLLGYCLAKGLGGFKLTGSNTDEDEKRQGNQDYAIEFADKNGQEYSYKIDWAAPANLPLFVGANIQKSLEEAGADTDASRITAFLRGLGNAFEPMLALSCLSGINDLFESARYAGEGEALYTVASQIATGYITQGIPALLRQADQATQENKQITFADSNDPTIRDLQTTAANVPFVGSKFKTDKVNAWGEKEKTSNPIINAFVNPGTLKKIDNSPLEQEISRLNKVQDTNVSPDSFPKVVSYTDKEGTFHKNHRLTEDQYQQLATTQGQTAKTILDKMIASSNYEAMTDEQKAKAMDMAYSYAREKAMAETLDTAYSESWMMKLNDGSEADQILQRTADNTLSSALAKLDTAWDENYSEENTAAYSQQLQAAFDSYSKMESTDKAKVRATATGTAAKYIEAREKGISHEDVINVVRNINNVKGTGAVDKDTGERNVRDIDKREAIAKTSGLSTKEVDQMMKVYMGDYDPKDKDSDKTELKYNYIRQELGLTPKQYAATYRASLDNSKKKDKIDAIMDLGFDRKTATALYNVYSSNNQGKKAYMDFYEKNGA